MYVDKSTLFSEQADVTASGVSAGVDLYPGYSGGNSPFILALASGFQGSGSLEIQLETSTDEAFAAARRVASFPISTAELTTGGEILAVSLPRNVERYVRLKYLVTAPVNALKISAMLALDI